MLSIDKEQADITISQNLLPHVSMLQLFGLTARTTLIFLPRALPPEPETPHKHSRARNNTLPVADPGLSSEGTTADRVYVTGPWSVQAAGHPGLGE